MSSSEDVIRVCIGTEPKTYVAQQVLQCSIARHTKSKVEFFPLIGPEWEYPTDLKVGTGFSLRRWLIPGFFGWEGKAIYLDADQLVLFDIADLWNKNKQLPSAGAAAWLTWQPDKYYKDAAPQTSVMLIDCAAARNNGFGWRRDLMIDFLRKHDTREDYIKFMHAEWMDTPPVAIENGWNGLNRFREGKTRLIHYTKEPEQPWYNPDHALAGIWQRELQIAMDRGYVTHGDLHAALGKWNVKEDWRNTNGLHPYYKKFLGAGAFKPEVEGKHRRTKRNTTLQAVERINAPSPDVQSAASQRILWVTSFNEDMYEVSEVVDSFLSTYTAGKMLIAHDGVEFPVEITGKSNLIFHNNNSDPFLKKWLSDNADIIPKELGGKSKGCNCPGGPFPDSRDKRHKTSCPGQWFNRNASRWFRKIVAVNHALNLAAKASAENAVDFIVWIDADCAFRRPVSRQVLEDCLPKPYGLFYFQNKRPVVESGLVGVNLSRGAAMLRNWVSRFSLGLFRRDKRWDDSWQLQQVIQANKAKCRDLATAVGKEHADVVEHSTLGQYIEHDKGKHGRKLGLMT